MLSREYAKTPYFTEVKKKTWASIQGVTIAYRIVNSGKHSTTYQISINYINKLF